MIEREFPNGSVSYDRETNSVYVYFGVEGKKLHVHDTKQLVDHVLIDVDREGYIIGVEVLG